MFRDNFEFMDKLRHIKFHAGKLIDSKRKLKGTFQAFHEFLEEKNPDKLNMMHLKQQVGKSENLVIITQI